MLTKLIIRNFKRFPNAEIELGNPVVFIGPNNSGKTTALQAIALWEIGLKRWNEKRAGKKTPEKRPGVAINRRDVIAVPVPDANLLWHQLHVRDVRERKVKGKTEKTQNVRIDIIIEGVSNGHAWRCGLEFDYANTESFFCRPLRVSEDQNHERMAVPDAAVEVNVAFLPPMSGLASNEARLDSGAINVRLGEGRTAEVLRNLCHQIRSRPDGETQWERICGTIHELFGISLDEPKYVPGRGEITMAYTDPDGTRLDLSSAGRGLQQTLLVLAHLTVNPKSVVLIDEPDAHLEILRQRQIYEILCQFAQEQGSQIIVASHSEVVLNEAADRDVVVAFVGRPHRVDDRGSQVLKSLKEIGFEQFLQAEQTGWVLYLEGSTDLSVLQSFARSLAHPAAHVLRRPFVRYVANQPGKARSHFFGLLEAKPDLVGIAIFDRIPPELQRNENLIEVMWSRREIENYLCSRDVLMAWAKHAGSEQGGGELFAANWVETMATTITEIEQAMQTLDKGTPWSPDTKVTDDFLDPLFRKFFEKLSLPNLLQKTDYHVLARFVDKEHIDREVVDALHKIADVAQRAKPV